MKALIEQLTFGAGLFLCIFYPPFFFVFCVVVLAVKLGRERLKHSAIVLFGGYEEVMKLDRTEEGMAQYNYNFKNTRLCYRKADARATTFFSELKQKSKFYRWFF